MLLVAANVQMTQDPVYPEAGVGFAENDLWVHLHAFTLAPFQTSPPTTTTQSPDSTRGVYGDLACLEWYRIWPSHDSFLHLVPLILKESLMFLTIVNVQTC